MEPLFRCHPYEWPPPLERPLVKVNSNIDIIISATPLEWPLFWYKRGGLTRGVHAYLIINTPCLAILC